MLAALTLLTACAQQEPGLGEAPASAVEVRVDPRVELVAAVFRLAGAPEYAERRNVGYADALEAHFAPFREHPAVAMARLLRESRGISYDAVMSYALHLGPGPDYAPRRELEGSALDGRWTPRLARGFARLLADFAAEADFPAFAAAQAERWALAERRMRALVGDALDVAWYEEWFGRPAPGSFTVVVAPGNGGNAYGPSYRSPEGEESFYAILGAWRFDERGEPVYDRAVLGTVVHEFAHSFVNPWVDAHEEALRPAWERLYPLVAERMREQAYASGRTMLCESLVRAAVVAYLRAHEGAEAAEAELARNEGRGFLWIRELDALLDGGFEPDAVLAWAGEAGPRWERKAAEMEAARPKLVESTPANGATAVEPSRETLVFRFDRPMDRASYSVMLGPGGQEAFPEVLEAGWDEAGRVFTLRVRLEPGHSYRFSLNGPQAAGFRAQAGGVLAPVEFRFETAPAEK